MQLGAHAAACDDVRARMAGDTVEILVDQIFTMLLQVTHGRR